MNKQIVEGFIILANGCEYGPTLMVTQEWDQELYEERKDASWCDNCFGEGFEDVDFDVQPGKKYRITVEEIKIISTTEILTPPEVGG